MGGKLFGLGRCPFGGRFVDNRENVRRDGQPLPLGVGVVLLSLACIGFLRKLEARAHYLPRELALLRQVPFLADLPPYDVERVARSCRWSDVPAGAVVIQQGEVGREFYVIDEGEVSITLNGERKPGTLGAGDFFGEVALLRRIPRTATVTAETDVRLLVVRGDDFLAAVTGEVDGGGITAEIASRYSDLAR